MSLVISDLVLEELNMTDSELWLELVILLFQQKRISIGRASRLVNMHLLQFQHELAIRKIPIHYDVSDFEADLQTLKELGRL
jgi:predicted HTH domain antitoxin